MKRKIVVMFYGNINSSVEAEIDGIVFSNAGQVDTVGAATVGITTWG